MAICDNCVHQVVCGKYQATGGVKQCEHYREDRKGKWIMRHNEKKCSACGFIYYANHDAWNGCPNCLAVMKGEEHG